MGSVPKKPVEVEHGALLLALLAGSVLGMRAKGAVRCIGAVATGAAKPKWPVAVDAWVPKWLLAKLEQSSSFVVGDAS